MSKLYTYRFSDLYQMSSGISSKPEQAGHGAPFLSFSTVFNNKFLPDSLSELMNTSEKEKESYSIKEGDIFLTRTSETLDELGMSSVALKDYPGASYSGFLKRLRPIKRNITYPKFMAFYLRSYLFRKAMNNNAIMTLRASLNEQIFSYLNLILPEYKVQVKIGDILYAIEQKIDVNNKINDQLEAMTKTVYDYWFVQFDFPTTAEYAASVDKPELTGKPYKSSGGQMVYNEALKREIPKGWSIERLKYFEIYQPETISTKMMEPDGKYSVFGSGGVLGRYNEYNHRESEIIISCRGNCGNIMRTLPLSWITGNAMVVKDSTGYFGSEFIYQMLNWVGINSIISGSVQKQITRTNLETLKFPVPEKRILNEFNSFSKPVVRRKIKGILENQKLAELRDWLLPMLMNGQVTVGEAKSELGMVAEESTNYKTKTE